MAFLAQPTSVVQKFSPYIGNEHFCLFSSEIQQISVSPVSIRAFQTRGIFQHQWVRYDGKRQ